MVSEIEAVKNLLLEKGGVKQSVFRRTLDAFKGFKSKSKQLHQDLIDSLTATDPSLSFSFKESGKFEYEMVFASDALVVLMHSNVFDFPEEHLIRKSRQAKDDRANAYCGTIYIYNFLADSIRYQRLLDPGYLLARIFINRNGHFWIQGKKRLSFLFQDFDGQLLDEESIERIISIAMQEAIGFDLMVPPLEHVEQITLQQKNAQAGLMAVKTGKSLGFDYQAED